MHLAQMRTTVALNALHHRHHRATQTGWVDNEGNRILADSIVKMTQTLFNQHGPQDRRAHSDGGRILILPYPTVSPPRSRNPLFQWTLWHCRTSNPTILQDIHYFTAHNFIGGPITGYETPTCILTCDANEGLKRTQEQLDQRNFILKMYDRCRTRRTVNYLAFVD